jgi:hypothetical protein
MTFKQQVYPFYLESDDAQQRIAKCIEHELAHKGNALACAAAILRDIKLGRIVLDPRLGENQ